MSVAIFVSSSKQKKFVVILVALFINVPYRIWDFLKIGTFTALIDITDKKLYSKSKPFGLEIDRDNFTAINAHLQKKIFKKTSLNLRKS